MGKKKRIRPLAICIFRHNDQILVSESYDSVKEQQFYRPLGGGIEFGEPSTETICRELMEELNVEVDKESLKYLGAVENIFTFEGTPSHEIILVNDGALQDAGLYERAVLVGQEADGEVIRAAWKGINEFGEGKSILYPTGLLEMLV
jgi:8-oxo-dGTP pyrophosphatase MutT (NUDIX family)